MSYDGDSVRMERWDESYDYVGVHSRMRGNECSTSSNLTQVRDAAQERQSGVFVRGAED